MNQKKINDKILAYNSRYFELSVFKLAVDHVDNHVIITDPDGYILYANNAAEKITGYPKKEMCGNRPSLWGKRMSKEFYRRMWKTIKYDKKTFVGELTNRRKNGEEYTAETRISPILDERGKVIFFVGIERDITQAKAVDRAKTELIYLASHQLRTPLTAIKWYLEMLKSDSAKLTKRQKKYLKEIYAGNERMIALVSALLNVSRIELGTFAVTPRPENIVHIAESVVVELRSEIAKKKLYFTKKYAALPKIRADAKLLRVVFQNLLSNSVKYTRPGGKISLSISKCKSDALIKITDTGCGIPKADQPKVFTKLFRADNAKAMDLNGTGLGLYVVKAIVDASGGEICFESKENKGTTFYVTLPMRGSVKKHGAVGLEPLS